MPPARENSAFPVGLHVHINPLYLTHKCELYADFHLTTTIPERVTFTFFRQPCGANTALATTQRRAALCSSTRRSRIILVFMRISGAQENAAAARQYAIFTNIKFGRLEPLTNSGMKSSNCVGFTRTVCTLRANDCMNGGQKPHARMIFTVCTMVKCV